MSPQINLGFCPSLPKKKKKESISVVTVLAEYVIGYSRMSTTITSFELHTTCVVSWYVLSTQSTYIHVLVYMGSFMCEIKKKDGKLE